MVDRFNDLKPRERRQFIKLLGASAGSLALAGCLGDDEDETDDTGQDDQATDVGDDDGEDPAEPDELYFVSSSPFPSLDPAKIGGFAGLFGNYNLYDPLITVNEDLELVGRLATDWESDDAQHWRVSLRDDVEFHDGGTMTAEDVVYTTERAQMVGTGISSLWSQVIEDVEAVDDNVVDFTLTETFGPFPTTLATHFVVDKSVVEDAEGEEGEEYLEHNSAGTGPYILEERQIDDYQLYTKFDNYFQGWHDNAIEQVRVAIIEEESTARQTMVTGEGHLTDQYLSPEGYEEIDNADGMYVYEDTQPSSYHLQMNTQKEPFDDLNVRRAFNLVYNAEEAAEHIWGSGHVATSTVPPGIPGRNQDLDSYGRDVDAAVAALDDSGYTAEEINEIGITAEHPAGFERQRRSTLLLQNNLRDIGIDIEVTATPWSQVTDLVTDVETSPDILSSTATANIPSPDVYTYQMHHPSQQGTYLSASWYTTDELTETLDNARTEPDDEARNNYYRDAQQMIYDAYPTVLVTYVPFQIGISERLGGFQDLSIMGASHQIHNFYWE